MTCWMVHFFLFGDMRNEISMLLSDPIQVYTFQNIYQQAWTPLRRALCQHAPASISGLSSALPALIEELNNLGLQATSNPNAKNAWSEE